VPATIGSRGSTASSVYAAVTVPPPSRHDQLAAAAAATGSAARSPRCEVNIAACSVAEIIRLSRCSAGVTVVYMPRVPSEFRVLCRPMEFLHCKRENAQWQLIAVWLIDIW